MQTDTHAALLAELPKEFVPELISMRGVHASVYIERAAWKRVRAFLRTSTGDTHMAVTEYKGTITIDDGCDLIIGQGPDDATALLAACRWLNEQEKR